MRLTAEKTFRREVPNDPDGAFVNIRVLSKHHLSSIESKCVENKISEDGAGSIVLNSHKRENLVARDCLTGWGNFFDEKGKELKFNIKNVTLAANFDITLDGKKVRFYEWVDSEHTKCKEEVDAEINNEAIPN